MKKPKIFIQDCGSYPHDILVIAGASKLDTVRFLKKNKVGLEYAKWFINQYDDMRKLIDTNNLGLFYFENIEKDKMAMGLFLQPYVNAWNYWEVLMHEIHHLVLHLAKIKGFLNEHENQAYLFEYLFRSIRRKLQGIDMV